MKESFALYAVILAAGAGSRIAPAAGGIPKQFLCLDGEPLYLVCARKFCSVAMIRGLVIAVPPGEVSRCERETESALLPLPWRVISGGATRQASVRNALEALTAWQPQANAVLIHDAARPFVSASLITAVADALKDGSQAVIPGIPVVDTIKEIQDGRVERTPPRAALRAIQTPQGFRLDILDQVHREGVRKGLAVTDDAALIEGCGHSVQVIDGERSNIKITNPEDLRLLAAAPKVQVRTGFGYDVHRYGQGRPLKLGGVPIPGAPEVVAHSDGDVLLHALADAILGAMGASDIGTLFPDTDPALEGIESGILLIEVLQKAREARLAVTHADCTIIAQIPKIAPHQPLIKKNLCHLLGLSPTAVSVKATTEERMGFTGKKKGIKAVAVVTAAMMG